jgi:hypothetical protein
MLSDLIHVLREPASRLDLIVLGILLYGFIRRASFDTALATAKSIDKASSWIVETIAANEKTDMICDKVEEEAGKTAATILENIESEAKERLEAIVEVIKAETSNHAEEILSKVEETAQSTAEAMDRHSDSIVEQIRGPEIDDPWLEGSESKP